MLEIYLNKDNVHCFWDISSMPKMFHRTKCLSVNVLKWPLSLTATDHSKQIAQACSTTLKWYLILVTKYNESNKLFHTHQRTTIRIVVNYLNKESEKHFMNDMLFDWRLIMNYFSFLCSCVLPVKPCWYNILELLKPNTKNNKGE